jgi:hypothetical protein
LYSNAERAFIFQKDYKSMEAKTGYQPKGPAPKNPTPPNCGSHVKPATPAIATGMTVQELCDKLTTLCHEGYAQAKVSHTVGFVIKDISNVIRIGDTTVMLSSKGENA